MIRIHALLVPVLALGLSALASAQSQRISGNLAHTPASLGGDVRDVFFSPDGGRLLYLADEERAGTIDLYSAPADGSAAPVKLSGTLPGPYGSIIGHRFTPDGSWVLFNSLGRTFLAPTDGSAPTVELAVGFGYDLTPDGTRIVWAEGDEVPERLWVGPLFGNGPATLLLEGLGYAGFEVTPDGERVVIERTHACYPCTTDLSSLPIDGSAAPVALNPSLPSVSRHIYAVASNRIVFAGQTSQTEMVLYSAPLDGSALPIALSGPMPLGEIHLAATPGGDRIVYALDEEVDGRGEIYSVPIDGSSAPVRLNGTLVAGGSVRASDPRDTPFQLTPDGARVVYRADQQVLDRCELFAAPVAGGFAVKLSGAMVSGGSVEAFQVAPDSVGVVFLADRLTNDVVELFGAPFGGGVARLSEPGPASGDVRDFQIAPDCAHVVYRGNLEAPGFELFDVSILGGASTKLSGALPLNAGVTAGWTVSPDSSRAAYVADELTTGILEAFTVPLTDPPSVHVNGPLDPGPASGDVTLFAALPGASGAVYIADGDDDDVFELYRADLGGTVTKLSGPLVAGGDVLSLLLTPDGSRVLYLADAAVDGRNDLYSIPVDGSAPLMRLNAPLVAGQNVLFPQLSPDGTRAVFFVFSASGARLYSAPVGGAALQQLSTNSQVPSLWADGRAQLSPDGAWVVYRTFTDIYAVPIDGGQPPRRLNGRFGPRHVIDFPSGPYPQFTLDSTRVVYVSDPSVAGRYELFDAPLDDGRAAARLSSRLTPGGDVVDFAIAPDGSRVVYRADQQVDERFELYSTPLDRGARFEQQSIPATAGVGCAQLNEPLTAGQSVHGFWISPDSARVIFDEAVDSGHADVFSVALDGSNRVRHTTGSHGASDLQFTPDGEHAVYHGQGGVCSLRTDGSEAPLQLFTDASGVHSPFAISADGVWVVVRDDLETSDVYELYARPLDGSLAAIRVSGPLPANGDVAGTFGSSPSPAFALTSDSAHVLYGADQDTDDVFELYLSLMPELP